VQFTSATATADGHTGTISDPNWIAQPVQLDGSGISDVSYGSSSGSSASSAIPSSLSSDGSSFSVAYQSGGYGYGGYPGDGYGPYGYGYGYGLF
jgi:hypothetical protein